MSYIHQQYYVGSQQECIITKLKPHNVIHSSNVLCRFLHELYPQKVKTPQCHTPIQIMQSPKSVSSQSQNPTMSYIHQQYYVGSQKDCILTKLKPHNVIHPSRLCRALRVYPLKVKTPQCHTFINSIMWVPSRSVSSQS